METLGWMRKVVWMFGLIKHLIKIIWTIVGRIRTMAYIKRYVQCSYSSYGLAHELGVTFYDKLADNVNYQSTCRLK